MGKDPKERTDRSATHGQALWRGLNLLGRFSSGGTVIGVQLTGFTTRMPRYSTDDALIVLRGETEDGTPMVAFHAAIDVAEAMWQALRKYESNDLRWKVDKYGQK